VKIYSELGQGTSVKIYLPRYHSEVDIAVAEPATIVPRGHWTETILMVEDDEDVRNHTRESLQELGYCVLEAANGRVALELIRRHPQVQLLFTDVGLPGGMNGRQLADQARRLKSNLKVLFTTGYARNAIVHGGRLDPGVELLPKPFTFPALAAKLRDILDASKKPPCILVVEDEILVQLLVTEILEEEGFRVELAGSATDATSKLRLLNGRVDAALIDIGLPDQKGDALAGELRAVHSSLPIVLATGYEAVDLRQRFSGQPLIAFLHKPYSAKQLYAALAAVGIAAPGDRGEAVPAGGRKALD
jgi:CheY-like chemotaxis protein